MRALVEACRSGIVPAVVKTVIASAPGSEAEAAAQLLGVGTHVVRLGNGYGERLLSALDGCEWVCLAGYLRLLPVEVLDQFPNRVLNIHPALLPKFGGKGMYGHHVHEAVLAAGETESGCTVHFVNEQYDDGAVILQKRCPVLPKDTADMLAARVLQLEHMAYAEALAKVIHERTR